MRSFKNYIETKDLDKEMDAKEGGLKSDKPGKPFGYMTGYDIYNAKGPLMENSESSKKAIEKFLIDLVKELKMIVAEKPVCYMSNEKEIKTMKHVGASAFVALEDSGIMLHTITNKTPKFACIDVFSCEEYDPSMIAKFMKKAFQTDHIIYEFIHRGADGHKDKKQRGAAISTGKL